MPTIKPIGYSYDRLVSGTAQFGNLAVAVINQDYGASPNDITFWATTDLDTGYNITVENPACDTPNNAGVPCCLSFYSTDTKDDTEFINLSNYLTGQGFTGATQAYSWLTNNGYWTSYKPSTALYYEVVDGKFIRQEYSPVSDTIWTTAYVTDQLTVFNGPNFDSSNNISIGLADAIGDLIYGPNIDRVFGSGINTATLQMYNPSNNSVITTLTVGEAGNNRRDMAYNDTDSTVWMVVPSVDKVYVISATTTSLTEITGITLSNFSAAPTSITWNSQSNLMYVGGGREIDVIDCTTKTKIAELNNIGDTGYNILEDSMVYDPVHNRVYILMFQSVGAGIKVYYLDCETNTLSASIYDTTGTVGSNRTLEYDPNGYVWGGKNDGFFVINTNDNSIVGTESLVGLSTDIIFKSSKNQMICARGSVYNAVIYDVTTVY